MDIFNCAALDVMHSSLEKFPNVVSVSPSEIATRVRDYFVDNGESDLDSQALFHTCHATIKWLNQEGFIIIEQAFMSGECRIVLTQKGLNALNSVPKFADSEKKSFGQYFLEGVKPLPFSIMGNLMADFFKSIS
ncbi:hypothetical protein V9657_004621 [Vibrio vulnificus]|nr:hypothetical protein [Vibrio vulnificus]EHH3082039.1 hypothetical protein [Vibrio vulnificus]EHU4917196.1 hypothetical protein [Vibrio vulnificus]EIZ1364039.1 hypothetical protein [Vibrio vulnificus]EJO3996193.1 hypothetical protein [Vibrio vulnificus]